MPVRLHVGSLLLWFVLAGCATPTRDPAAEAQLPVVPEWLAAGDSLPRLDVEGPWWTDFSDPILGGLIEEAMAENYDLRVARSRLAVAEEAARIAGADQLPSVNLGIDAAKSQNPFGGVDPLSGRVDTASISESFELSLSASWELDVWGRVRNLKQAARFDFEQARADFAFAELSLAGNTAKAWYALVAARLQTSLAAQTLASYRETETLVRERYEAGLTSALDLRLIRSERATSEQRLAEQERLRAESGRVLDLFLGQYPDAEASASDQLPAIVAAVPSGLPSDLLLRRPDLRAAAMELISFDYRLAAAKKALLPSFRLTGSAGTRSDELGNLVDDDFSFYNLLLGATKPIFQGGRLRATVRQTEAQREGTLARYAQTALEAFREVEDALTSETTLAREEAALREAVEEAEAAEELAREEYSEGLTDITTVLDAQRRAFQSRSSLLRVQQQRLANRIDLHLALGGGYRSPANETL